VNINCIFTNITYCLKLMTIFTETTATCKCFISNFSDSKTAALFGRREERQDCGTQKEKVTDDFYGIGSKPRPFDPLHDNVGGSGFYRSATLKSVGGFNPYLCSLEEKELCTRILRAGYRVLYVPHAMISHSSLGEERFRRVQDRFAKRMFFGYGQILRLYGIRCLPSYAPIQRPFCVILCCVAGGASLGLTVLLRNGLYLGGWILVTAALLLAFVAKTKSLKKPAFNVLSWLAGAVGIAVGYIQRVRSASEYPIDVLTSGNE
jgi:hypothetical protein